MKNIKLFSALTVLTGLFIMPLTLLASVTGNFTDNVAPAATLGTSATDGLVMDVTIPDAWNSAVFTPDTLLQDSLANNYWQGGTLHAFPALGTTAGVGFKEFDAGIEYNAGEAVVRDLDADGVYTSGADTLGVDQTDGAPAAGTTLFDVVAGDRLCSDSADSTTASLVWTSTADGADLTTCTADDTLGLQLKGAGGVPALHILIVTGDNWAKTDAVIDNTTDIYKENVAETLTYSAAADDDVYSIGGLVAGDVLSNFPADCDGAGPETAPCGFAGPGTIDATADIYLDKGTAGGAAPNSVVDRQDDRLNAITVQNTGTAVDTTDIVAVNVWADNGSGGFGPGDALLGAAVWDAVDSWDLSGLTQAVSAGGQRIFVTVNTAAAPTNARTIIMKIPQMVDGGVGGSYQASDLGVFMASNNDGPTNADLINGATQTIDSAKPTFQATTVTADTNNDGTVDQITIDFSEPVNIVDGNAGNGFAGLALGNGCIIANANYAASGVTQLILPNLTGCTADSTNITPSVTYSTGTAYTIADVAGNEMANAHSIAAADGSAPVPLVALTEDIDANGKVDALEIIFSEAIDDSGIMGYNAGVNYLPPTFAVGNVSNEAIDASESVCVHDTGEDDQYLCVVFDENVGACDASDQTGCDTGVINQEATWNGVSVMIRDLAAIPNMAGDYTPGSIPVDDEANPVVVARVTKDTNQTDGSAGTTDGKLDGVLLTFSEPMDASLITGASFDMYTSADVGLTETFSDAASVDDTIFFGVTDSAAGDTGDLIKSQIVVAQVCDRAAGIENCIVDPVRVSSTDGAGPVALSSKYQDLTGNGVVDNMVITFSADTGLACSFESNDWMMTPSDIITGITGSCSVVGNVMNLGLTGNANKTGSAIDPTIRYLNNATPDSLDDGAGNPVPPFGPMNVTDAAGPYMVSGAYSDSNSDGKVDRVVLTYTENTTFTMAGADWNFSTPSNMNLINDFENGLADGSHECSGSGTTTITCTDAGTGTFDADANETGISVGAQPAWTYTSSANVTDGLTQAPTQTLTLADNANPIATGATLNYNDNIKELVVTFSEEVDTASSDETKLHINNVTGVDDVTLTLPTTTGTPTATSLSFPLTEAQRAAALLMSGVTGGAGGAVVLDMDAGAATDISAALNTSLIDDNNTVVETADTHVPALTQWDINYITNQLTLTFSETVDAGTLTPTALTIQDAATATTSYTLTGGTTVSLDGTTIVLDMLIADVDAIKSTVGLAKDIGSSYLRTTALLIDDIATNGNAAIADGAAIQASSFTGSGTFGDLNGTLLLSSDVIYNPAKARVSFQVQNALPTDGKIEITFPNIFNVASVATLENIVGLDGTYTVTVVGKTVTVTRTGGTILAPLTNVSFSLVQVINPSVLGLTPDFTFKTKTSTNAIIDQDLTVLGQTIIMPPAGVSTVSTPSVSSGGGGGGGYRAPGSYLLKPILPSTDEEETTTEGSGETPSLPAYIPGSAPVFEDTQNHWAQDYIAELADRGIVTGKTDTEFAPDDDVSRAELLKIALGAFGFSVPESVTEKPLPDVEIGDWYAPYVKAGLDNQIIYGFQDGFQPNAPASRGMSATVLAKAAGFEDIWNHYTNNYMVHDDWTYAVFPDVPKNAYGANYFAPYVAYLHDQGIIDGYADGTFGPGKPITRAEIAKIVTKLLDMFSPTEGMEGQELEAAECGDLADKLESCTLYSCSYTDPETKQKLDRVVSGYQDGVCEFFESQPDGFTMECQLPSSGQANLASYYKDPVGSKDKLQTELDNGNCTITLLDQPATSNEIQSADAEMMDGQGL